MCSRLGKAGFQIRVLKFAVSVLSSQVTGLLAAYSGRQFFAVLVAQSDGGLGLRRGGGRRGCGGVAAVRGGGLCADDGGGAGDAGQAGTPPALRADAGAAIAPCVGPPAP